MCEFTMLVTDYLLSPISGAKDPMTYDCMFCLFFLSCLFGNSEDSPLELSTISRTYEGVRTSDEGNTVFCGRAIAQAVSRMLPTAAARVRPQGRSCGICAGQSGTGAGFLWVLRFLLPILIAPTAPHSSSGAGKIGQLVADVPSGFNLAPPQET
jgi:hypothetical protein